MLAISAPAAAQIYSDGFKFLQAVKNKEGDVATALLDAPGSTVVNARDISSGETGLHIVVQRRDLVWINWLAQKGANPNIQNRAGVTPLMLAAQLGYTEGVSALIAAGARVDVANAAGETPLMLAVHRRDTAMLRVLLEAGADPDRNDNSGRSAREYAELTGRALVDAINRHERSADGLGSGPSYGPAF